MGRKDHRLRKTSLKPNPERMSKKHGISRRQHSQRVTPKTGSGSHNSSESQHGLHIAAVRPSSSHGPNVRVPFTKSDNILLVGEGDFSFASSLAKTEAFRYLTATSFDSRQLLEEKYPGIGPRLNQLQGLQKLEAGETEHDDHENENGVEWNGFDSSPTPESTDHANGDNNLDAKRKTNIFVHFDIDATKLSTSHKKILRRNAPFSKIVFNFPHVGGVSTDVNRQVRSNQQLLVGFFNAAKVLLASPSNPTALPSSVRHQETYATSDEDEDLADNEGKPSRITSGSIVVTLFEGEPYTLWNIRDLARHCGLKVVESFKFPWAAYPGYQHARTLGEIVTGRDRSDQGKRKGAWRGEEREARSYILTLKEAQGSYPTAGQGKKRKKDEDESD